MRASSGPPTAQERRRRGLAAALACCLALASPAASPAHAQTKAGTIDPVRLVAPNGLTMLVLEQPALPIVQLHALVRAGSAQDPEERAGLANLVASMLDEGTTSRNAQQIAEEIDFVGGSLRTRVTEDYTTVSVKVLAKDVPLGFALLADVLLNPTFPEEELSRLRSQVLGEIRSELENPEQVAMKAFHRLVFEGHPYRWPVNGTMDTVAQVTRGDVQAFYEREYLPNQTILAVVGDITPDQVTARVAAHFGAWERRAPPARAYPPPKAVRTPTVRLIDQDLTQSTIVLGHVGVSRTDPDYYAISVMNYILGAGGFSSRLMDAIRDRQGLAYGVGSAFEANLMPGAFLVSLQTRNEAANQAIEAVRKEIRAIREEKVTEQELEETKSYLIGSFPLRLDTVSDVATVLSLVELYGLGLEYFTRYPAWIGAVTRDDVLRVARAHLDPNRYVLVLVGKLDEARIALEGAHRLVDRHE